MLFINVHHLHISIFIFCLIFHLQADECQFLTMCKCTNFPLFALIDTNYLSKPRSGSNQDLFCTYSSDLINETKLTTFDQFKYFYYRFRTLTFANYPLIPSQAFRFIHFESQSVKQTTKSNNRNVIAFVHIDRTQSGIFDELSLTDSQEQLMVSFLDSPSLIYAHGGLSKLKCYELKFYRTNPSIPLDFFFDIQSIHHLIIDNPSFPGFLSPTQPFEFQLEKLSIKDISIRHLSGKHFPMKFFSVRELILENFHQSGAFRSFNHQQLAESFPQLRSLKIFSISIQHLTGRMFESFGRLEYLKVNGITTIENEAFYNLYHLKELHLGRDIRRLDPYAFLHMTVKSLFLNESLQYQVNDEKDFCTFAQFSPLTNVKTFVQFPLEMSVCSCTLRYVYRHLDKSLMFTTPSCYANSSLYILAQEERLCYFEQRLLQCHVLPDEGVTIYGKHYNVSHFYQQQRFQQQQRWRIFYQYRIYLFIFLPVFLLASIIVFCLVRHEKQNGSAYRHLNRLLQRRTISSPDQVTVDMIYHRTTDHSDIQSSTIPISSKV